MMCQGADANGARCLLDAAGSREVALPAGETLCKPRVLNSRPGARELTLAAQERSDGRALFIENEFARGAAD